MSSILEFSLGNFVTDEPAEVRRFTVVDVEPQDFWDTIGDESGPWFDFIEELEFSEGPTSGTIDQTSTMSQDKKEVVWTIGSVEIEDRQAFIDLVIDKLADLFDWYLEEIKS